MSKRFTTVLAMAALLAATFLGGAFAKQQVIIESWRTDDLKLWKDVIIPAFNKHYPDIEVVFSPTAPAEYNAVLDSKLQAGTAGDLITCRPFGKSLELYNKGHLAPLNDLPGMEHFSEFARAAWTTDDGSVTYCVPMASVIHGFLYNKDLFDKYGYEPPKTYEEFIDLLAKMKKDAPALAPLVMGTKDQWEAATMGWHNIAPNYYGGEAGRKAFLAGKEGFHTDGFLQGFEALAQWAPYLPRGYKAVSYSDAQQLFTQGRGFIYPAGSWDIGVFHQMNPKLNMGAFKAPPPAGATKSYISDHPDIALGLNPASKNQEAAKKFLEWLTTEEFADLYGNALPGFFPLHDYDITIKDPVANEFLSWRQTSEGTFRMTYYKLSDQKPDAETDLWTASVNILNGNQTPEEAAKWIECRLSSWYQPHKHFYEELNCNK